MWGLRLNRGDDEGSIVGGGRGAGSETFVLHRRGGAFGSKRKDPKAGKEVALANLDAKPETTAVAVEAMPKEGGLSRKDTFKFAALR